MTPNPPEPPVEPPAPPGADDRYVLRLFVSGMTPRSARAVAAITELCEKYLVGRFELEVIDIYLRPDLAGTAQVIAVPTLVKERPEPLRRFIGDLTDTERLLTGMGLRGGSTGWDKGTGLG